MSIIDTWWAWVCFGVGLVIFELLLPAYFFLGFGIGAVLTGITLLFGVTVSAQNMFLLFACLSFVSWYALKRVFRHPKSDVKTFDHDINDG